MGVSPTPAQTPATRSGMVPAGSLTPPRADDPLFRAVSDELTDKGFIVILTVGLVYEWKKGALEWD